MRVDLPQPEVIRATMLDDNLYLLHGLWWACSPSWKRNPIAEMEPVLRTSRNSANKRRQRGNGAHKM